VCSCPFFSTDAEDLDPIPLVRVFIRWWKRWRASADSIRIGRAIFAKITLTH